MGTQHSAILLLGLIHPLFPEAIAAQEHDETGSGSDLTSALSPDLARKVDVAIDRGLEWLSTQQSEDGSFKAAEERSKSFTSCHAALAYLSRGHQPGRGRIGQQLTRVIDYLLTLQHEDGSFYAGPRLDGRRHPTVAVTLCELYGTTAGEQADRMRAAIQRGLGFSRRQQTPKGNAMYEGGWSYSPNAPPSILNTSVWEMMFLRSASNAGFDVPAESVHKAVAFVARCYISDRRLQIGGVFRREPGDPRTSYGYTGMGMLALQLHGRRDDPMVLNAADWVAALPVAQQGQINGFYRHHYVCAQAMAQVGGEHWKKFFPPLVATLLPLQAEDGHWLLAPGTFEDQYGDVYNTALAVLLLTLPDQLLPIHQR